jgi:hypothetical protein
MKQEPKLRKQFSLPISKIKKAKAILSAKTDAEAVDIVIADEEIRKVLLSVKGFCNIEDVYGRLIR